jgi:hypothetical protein
MYHQKLLQSAAKSNSVQTHKCQRQTMDVSKTPKATCNAHGSITPGKWNQTITTRRISTALEVWVISHNCLRAPIKFASKHIPNTIWALPIFHPATVHPPQIPIPIIQYQVFICITNQWSKRVGGRRVGNLTLKRKRSESAPLGTSSNRSQCHVTATSHNVNPI